MLRSVGKRARAVAMLGLVAALALAGVAAAQGGSSGGKSDQSGQGAHAGRHHGPPPLGAEMKGLTYAEFHVQNKEGEAQVIRLDAGKITAVDSSSITLEENDGSEVTIALGEDTKVVGKPGAESSVEDLKTGQRVSVSGPKDGTAKVVMVAPKKGQRMGAGQGRGGQQGPPQGQQGPPPGAPQGQQGGQQGAY